MSLADMAFKEHYSFEEVREIIELVGIPCEEGWAYKKLNQHYLHLALLCKNYDKTAKRWVKENRPETPYLKKSIKKLSAALGVLDTLDDQLGSDGIDNQIIHSARDSLATILQHYKGLYASNEKHLENNNSKLINLKVLSIITGIVIPGIYREIFKAKWSYSADGIDYLPPEGPGVKFTEKILEKHGIQASRDNIVKAYQRHHDVFDSN